MITIPAILLSVVRLVRRAWLMPVAEMKLIWDLRDDPETVESLRALPGASGALGGGFGDTPAAGSAGPPAGSDEWWDAVEDALDEEPIRGVVEEVDLRKKQFVMRTEDGQELTGVCRGGTDHYFEGWGVELVLSYLPTGFVPGRYLHADGGLLVEIWVED